MKRLINISSIICCLFLAFTLASCNTTSAGGGGSTNDQNGNGQNDNSKNQPKITITTNFDGDTISEGGAITYIIKSDKPLDKSMNFDMTVTGGKADPEDYVMKNSFGKSVTSITYPPSSTERVSFSVEFAKDGIPEKPETISYTIKSPESAKGSLSSKSTFVSEQQLTIENVSTHQKGVYVWLNWSNPNVKLQLWAGLYWPENGPKNGSYLGHYSQQSSNKPKHLYDDLDWVLGDQYYCINITNTAGQSKIDYTFRVGFPDGHVKIYQGTYTFSDSTRIAPGLQSEGVEAQRFVKITAHKVNGEKQYVGTSFLDPNNK